MQSVLEANPHSQDVLNGLVEDVRTIRQRSFSKNPRSKTGIAAGQFLILLLQIQKGERLTGEVSAVFSGSSAEILNP